MRKINDDKKSLDPKILQMIDAIRDRFLSVGEVTPETTEELKALRLEFIEIKQPTLVKSIRLYYELLEAEGEFEIEPWEDDDTTTFEYFLGLLANPFNKYNRDEIRELNIYLKHKLEGVEYEFGQSRLDSEEEEEG